MALNKDILGQSLYNRTSQFNEIEITPEQIEAKRLEYWKAVADEFINHFKTNGVLSVPGAGLIAPSGGGTVTGTSITGTIE